MSSALYPLFLDLEDRPVTVIGGGAPAERRVRRLLEAGARITVVSPELTPELERLAADGSIVWRRRRYRPGDLAGAWLVAAERLDPATNRAVFAEAEERGIFANVEDDIEHCSFHAPSIVRQGDLTVAISTAGRAPALAVRLRQQLERRLGPEYARFLELAGRLRARLAAEVPEFEERRRRWYRLVDSPVLSLLRRGQEREAAELTSEILGVRPTADTDDALVPPETQPLSQSTPVTVPPAQEVPT